jgi:hypothetical protein
VACVKAYCSSCLQDVNSHRISSHDDRTSGYSEFEEEEEEAV